MYRILYKMSFVFFSTALSKSSSEIHCVHDAGICLHSIGETANSFSDAQDQCSRRGWILLEIYNEVYKNIVIDALIKWRTLDGWWLLFGLECKNDKFYWLTTGLNVDIRIAGMENFKGTCKSFLIWKDEGVSELRVVPSVDNINGHRFICLEDNNSRSSKSKAVTTTMTTPLSFYSVLTSPGFNFSIATISTILGSRYPELDGKKNQEERKEEGDEGRRIGIGVGVGLAGMLIFIAIITAGAIFIKTRRLNQMSKSYPTTFAAPKSSRSELQTPELSIPPDESTLNYAELNFSNVQRENDIYG